MEDSIEWKVGDRFKVPASSHYKSVYTILRIDDQIRSEVRYWAYYPETRMELHAGASDMERVSPLQELL